jgi:small-conductance mechanosensitive channel
MGVAVWTGPGHNPGVTLLSQAFMPAALFWLASAYALVVGLRFAFVRRGDLRILGIGLLMTVAGWVLLRLGVEASVPITMHLPEGIRQIEIPLLRTLAEIGLVIAAISLLLMALSGAMVALTGSDMIRLQKALIRTGLFLIGLTVIWQAHFAEQFSIRNLLIGAGGALVFIVGLGLQRTMGNLFSGFDLQADQVIRKGDWVQLGVGGPEGTVFDTSLRTTRILTNEGQMMIVANADLLGRSLFNLDQPDRRLRVRRTVGVAYGIPPIRVKDAILGVLLQDPGVLRPPQGLSPEVFVQSYAESSVHYDIRFWVADRRAMDPVVDRVMTRIWYVLREGGMEIPFPVRSIRMVDMDRERQDAAHARQEAEAIERQLAACPLFSDQAMSASQRRELARDSAVVELHPGEFAVRRGELSDHMFLVLQGSVEVRPEGRDPVPLGTGASFGEVALLRGEPRIADVVGAASGARLLRMSRLSVLPVLQRHPSLAGELSRLSQARREASGVLDDEAPRTTLLQRCGAMLRTIVRELRPW